MEREVGGGIGMGNTCKPMADSFQCMKKFTTNKKIKKKRNGAIWRSGKRALCRHRMYDILNQEKNNVYKERFTVVKIQ